VTSRGVKHLSVLSLVLCAGLAGVLSCGAASRPVQRVASMLSVTLTPIPHFRVAGYPNLIVDGSYPQVSFKGSPLRAVNAQVRSSVEDQERKFAKLLSARRSSIPEANRIGLGGEFRAHVSRSLLSANTTAVSVLMPLRACEPGATGCDYWLSVTVRVPSGKPIAIRQLFRRPTLALDAIARLVKADLGRGSRCVTAFQDLRAIAPMWRNYRAWALTERGLVVAFDTGRVSLPLCGPVSVTIPYARLMSYVGAVGKELIAAVKGSARS